MPNDTQAVEADRTRTHEALIAVDHAVAVDMAREMAVQAMSSLPSTHVVVCATLWLHDASSRIGIRFAMTLDAERVHGFRYRLEPHQLRDVRQVRSARAFSAR